MPGNTENVSTKIIVKNITLSIKPRKKKNHPLQTLLYRLSSRK
jgi:hypothetical protein